VPFAAPVHIHDVTTGDPNGLCHAAGSLSAFLEFWVHHFSALGCDNCGFYCVAIKRLRKECAVQPFRRRWTNFCARSECQFYLQVIDFEEELRFLY